MASTSEQLKRELSDLVVLSLDGTLDDSQVARLNELIISSSQLREHYLACLSVQIGLASIEVQGSQSNTCVDQDNVLRDIVEAQLAAQENDANLLNQSKEDDQPLPSYHRTAISPLAIWQVCGAIAALIAVAMILNVMQPEPYERGTLPIAKQIEKTRLAKIISASQLQWHHDEESVIVGQVLEEGKYDIKLGHVRLEMAKGVELLLEGPVSFELVSESLINLHNGKIAVHNGIEGFKVDTPEATFMDLGTDFGVEVNATGSELHVSHGQVALYPGPKDTKRPFELFRAGQAGRVNINSTKIIPIAYDRYAFIYSVPSQYELLVRESNPVAYWRFDNDSFGRLSNSIDNSLNYIGTYRGNVKFADGPQIGEADKSSAIKLDGKNSYVHISNLPNNNVNKKKDYSYSMWVRPDFDPADVNAQDNYYLFVGYGRYGHLLLSGDGYFTHQFVGGSSSDGGKPFKIQKNNSKFTPGQWYHLVVTAKPGFGKILYVNGKRCASVEYMGESGDTICKEIFIGDIYRSSISYKPGVHDKSFKGDIAETVLYDRELTANEILNLYNSK